MNVYDFDGTIYRGDSTRDFYFYLLVRHPKMILDLPHQLSTFFRYKSGKCDKTAFKENFYCFLRKIQNIEETVLKFWDKNERKIAKWYLCQKQTDDIVISASPEFLLDEICLRLKVTLIASKVDPCTGKYTGKNCRGEEKVKRFYECFPNGHIDGFWSDSDTDSPMAEIAQNAFFVRKEKITPWQKTKHSQ